MLLYPALLSALHLFFILDGIHSEKPPTVKGSFYAVGEIVTTLQDGTTETTIFEESLNVEDDLTAAEFRASGIIIRISEDLKTRKTFVIEGTVDDVENANCREANSSTWITMNIEPHLKEFEVVKGKIVLPIRQLLLLQDKSLIEKFTDQNYRGISAQMWRYKTSTGAEIDAYWSIGELISPSKYHAVPLGFKITRANSVSYISVFNFQHDQIRSSLFEPMRGVYCEGRSEELYTFPKEVNELVEFAYSMEVVLQGSDSIASVDTWIDIPHQIIRTDYDPYGREAVADVFHTVTEIVSLKQGAKYELTQEVVEGCLVDAMVINPDMQILFDYTNASRWSGKGFFGLDQTTYFYAGKTNDRGIPCYLYHGKREDFPYGSTGFSTVWEWCITDELKSGTQREKVFPVVSLNIYFKKVNEDVDTLPARIFPGSKLTYHFYHAQHLFEVSNLFSEVFDIEHCFSAEDKADRVLTVQVTDKQRPAIESLVHDLTFVYKWWKILQETSTLNVESLRLTNLRLRIGATGPLYVFFTILNSHADLPNKEIFLRVVLDLLEQEVKNDKIKVSQLINGESVTLVAEKMEAVARLGSAAKMQLLSPESKINNLTKSNPITAYFSPPQIRSEDKSKVIEDGWALGIVVGVGAAMLVSGVGLGIFSGASGIVLRRKYAPSTN